MTGAVPAPRLTRPMIVGFAGMAALGSMAMHLLVPALPVIAKDLAARQDDVQLAITLFIVGLSIGQFVSGPLADRIGRRPVLLGGLALFTGGSIVCAAATGIKMLIFGRLFQALGGAATLTAVRATIFDRARPHETASHFATLTAVILLSPTIAPVVGGVLAAFAGWRAIFWLVALFGALGCGAALLRIGESRIAGKAASGPVEDMLGLLRNSRFLAAAGALACASTTLYLFLGVSAFLLIGWGLQPGEAGFCYALVALAALTGTRLVSLAERHGGAVRLGFALILLGAVIMLIAALLGGDGIVTLIGPMLVVALGTGVSNPAALAATMRADPPRSGTAASLAGAGQMLVSGVVTSLVVSLHIKGLAGLAACLCASGGVGLLLAIVRRESR